MYFIKHHLTAARTLGVVIVATLGLAACATPEDIAAVNSRIDQLDARVQGVAQTADAANQSAQRANQRIDELEGRVQRLETLPPPPPPRRPRG